MVFLDNVGPRDRRGVRELRTRPALFVIIIALQLKKTERKDR